MAEAMRGRKVIEKVQERRLHQFERAGDATNQKTQDDASIGRCARAQKERLTELDRTEPANADRT